MKKLFFYLKKISKLKFQFKLPKKNRVVLYDEEGDHIMSLFLNKKDYHSMNTRLEKINISVLIISLLLLFIFSTTLPFTITNELKLDPVLDFLIPDSCIIIKSLNFGATKFPFSVQLYSRTNFSFLMKELSHSIGEFPSIA